MPLLLQSAQITSDWFKDPVTSATTVVALASVVNLIIAALMWRVTSKTTKITRDIFEASHRPYVHISGITFTNDTDKKSLRITVMLLNVGSVPAYNFNEKVVFMLTGKEGLNLPDIEEKGTIIIYPQASIESSATLSDPTDYNLITKRERLGLTVAMTYKGAGRKKYQSEHKYVFSEEQNKFVKISDSAT